MADAIDDSAGVEVALYTGDRAHLRPLFEVAEDSAALLDGYIDDGRVLVARLGDDVVGHLQLVPTGEANRLEIKNMAVREQLQRQGIGRQLVRAAVELATGEGWTAMVVATGAADVGNLRFYQRQGFRLLSVERDAFTTQHGYPAGIVVDGIELRDRVWLDQPLPPASG